MALQHRFDCPLPNGIHARPASVLEEQAGRFRSRVALVNGRNGRRASLDSVLALVAADVRYQDPIELEIAGPDETAALASLAAFVRDELPHLDDSLPVPEAAPGEPRLPKGLRESGAGWWPGRPVSRGIGRGRIVEATGIALPAELLERRSADPDSERQEIDRALRALLGAMDEELARAPGGVAARVVQAHRAVARDPEFRSQLLDHVNGRGGNAVQAVVATQAHFTRVLEETGSQVLRERVLDIQDVCSRLLSQIVGGAVRTAEVRLTEESIVLADRLTPSQFLALDRRLLRGLVLRQGGVTSHTVILARSFAVPTLVGWAGPDGRTLAGREAIVDAELGLLAVDLDEPARRYYARQERRQARREHRLREAASRPGTTRDGVHLEVGVNISAAEEAAPAFGAGAEEVGLFRTELLFAGRDQPPPEELQLRQYRQVLEAASGRPVIIRTLDAGGDKPIPYLGLPGEANPFLGRRGVRVYPACEAVFRTQVRALWRASALGSLRLLVPMVSCLEEVRWVGRVVEEEKRRLEGEGIPTAARLPLGVMVETPALAFSLDHLAREVDYFSVGTNDLLQYFFAAERGNPEMDAIASPLQPAFLRLLRQIVTAVHAQGKRVGFCGEMAGCRRCLPLLVGLGADEISLSPPSLGEIKGELRGLWAAACRALIEAALECQTAGEVAELLDGFQGRTAAPVVAEDLIELESDSRDKTEAIQELVGLLSAAGRTDAPHALEDAVWAREAAGPTGLGGGVAVPHCLSGYVGASSLALLRLGEPLEWGSVDGRPVRLLVLLAVREAERQSHLRFFSRLARRLVDEEFRRVLLEDDAGTILRSVREALESGA